MAEGWLRHLAGDRFEVHSAGTEATSVRPLAIKAMAEAGIDISQQTSKTLDRYLREPWDYVITVCDQANEACPFFPGGKHRLHWSFPDPSAATGTEEQKLAVYRRVRDAIRTRLQEILTSRPASKRSGLCGRAASGEAVILSNHAPEPRPGRGLTATRKQDDRGSTRAVRPHAPSTSPSNGS